MLSKHFLSKMFEDQIEFKNRTDNKTQNTERRNAC